MAVCTGTNFVVEGIEEEVLLRTKDRDREIMWGSQPSSKKSMVSVGMVASLEFKENRLGVELLVTRAKSGDGIPRKSKRGANLSLRPGKKVS